MYIKLLAGRVMWLKKACDENRAETNKIIIDGVLFTFQCSAGRMSLKKYTRKENEREREKLKLYRMK